MMLLDNTSQEAIEEDKNIEDEAQQDLVVAPIQYDITSYGADFDVEGLVKRLKRSDILIPDFQRGYIWSQPEASRFIESLLLGLPVPAVFLARERTNKLLVIDGQQRLKTLQFFYDGYFNPKKNEKKSQIFSLVGVQPKFEGLTYEALDEKDRIRLNDSLIHSIIISQESPKDEDTSIYYLFDRLNTPGRPLTPHEIRTAIARGNFIDLVKELNDNLTWRHIYGKKHLRLKDQELILRFLALFFNSKNYQRPMNEFLNKFSLRYKDADEEFLQKCRIIFANAIDIVWENIGQKAFRPERALNAAVFDSVMVGLARRIEKSSIVDLTKVKEAYEELLKDEEYRNAVSQSTSDEANVQLRLRKATEKFDRL